MKTFKSYLNEKEVNFLIKEDNAPDGDNYTNIWNNELDDLGIFDGAKSAYYYIKYKLQKSDLTELLNQELESAKAIVNLEIQKLSDVKSKKGKKSSISSDLILKKDRLQDELSDINDDIRYQKDDENGKDLRQKKDSLKAQIATLNKQILLGDKHGELNDEIENLTVQQIDDRIDDLKLKVQSLIKETDSKGGTNPYSKRYIAKERSKNSITVSKMLLDSKLKFTEAEREQINSRIERFKKQKEDIELELNSEVKKQDNNPNSNPNSNPNAVNSKVKNKKDEIDLELKELPTDILKFFTIIGNLKSISNDKILKYKKELNSLIEKNKDNKSVKKVELIKQFNEIVKSLPKEKKGDTKRVFNINLEIQKLTDEDNLLSLEDKKLRGIINNPNSVSDPEVLVKIPDIKNRIEKIRKRTIEIDLKIGELKNSI